MKKLALFLATEKGFSVLQRLCETGYTTNIACVISFHEIGVQKDWCVELKTYCKSKSLTFYLWKDVKNNLVEFVKTYEVTSILAISWGFLLPLELNDYLEDKIIVFHDSLLPKYRGFAPVVTAMLCGDCDIGATALYATETVDSGDIILQEKITIASDEYIQDVILRISKLYADMAVSIMKKIINESITAIPQDDSVATYSIWRDENDYEIDWKKNSTDIYNQIRATGYPYKCSYTRINGEVIRIVKASIETDVEFEMRDFGKIWKLNDGKPSIICGKGILRIDKAIREDGRVYEFTKLRMRLGV